MRPLSAATALIAFVLWASPATAVPITYDFEEFEDSEAVTALLAPLGVTLTLTNAIALTTGISGNEFDFPPMSGNNTLFDGGGAITIAFSSAVTSLSGFFTYGAPLTLTAFLGGAEVGSVSSLFDENHGSSLNPSPNELIGLVGLGLFDRVVIFGAGEGGTFTLDDLTVDVPEQTSSVPEPGTLTLVALGAAALFRRRARR
jgi:hypothetical protein